MNQATIEKELFINETDDTNVISGYLTLKSSETLVLDKIKGVVFLEARGRMSSQKNEINTFKIEGTKRINRNETYEIPFTFSTSDYETDSYIGKNVSFSYNLEIQIDVNEADVEKLDRSLFSKVKSFVTSDDSIKISKYFKVENLNYAYNVVEAKASFDIQANPVISLITALVIGGIYYFQIPEFNLWYVILGIAIIILMIFIITKLIGSRLGAISMETLKDEDAFICKILKTRSFNLMNPKLHYQIIEKVIDKRGTSSTTRTETIYTSELHKMSNLRKLPVFKFSYPKKNGLSSYKFKDASILWQMNIEGKFLGLTLKYKCFFTVERKVA